MENLRTSLSKLVKGLSKTFVGKKSKTAVVAVALLGFAVLLTSTSTLVLAANGGTPPAIFVDTVNGQPGPFSYVCPANPLFNPVTIVGHGVGSAPPGDISQYGVQIDWGDGTVEDATAVFTPPSGKDNFEFTFTAGPHVYAQNQIFTYTAKLYHQNGNGNDNSVDGTIQISACVEPEVPGTI